MTNTYIFCYDKIFLNNLSGNIGNVLNILSAGSNDQGNLPESREIFNNSYEKLIIVNNDILSKFFPEIEKFCEPKLVNNDLHISVLRCLLYDLKQILISFIKAGLEEYAIEINSAYDALLDAERVLLLFHVQAA